MVNQQKNKASRSWIALGLRFGGLAIFDAGLLWLIMQLVSDGAYPLASILIAIGLFVTVVFTVESLKAFRWMSVGIGLAMLFVLYPLLYTFYLSTTNTGVGHVLTQQQAIDRLEREQYVPEGGTSFSWTAFLAPDASLVLWLVDDEGSAMLASEGELIDSPDVGQDGIGELDEDGIPVSIEGYQRLEVRDVLVQIDAFSQINFGDTESPIRITSLNVAATTEQRYQYDAEQGSITDLKTGTVYTAERGTFRSGDETLSPGFFINIGLDNFERFFGSSVLRGPLVNIIGWNFAYAILSVLCSFALGLFIAILFDKLPGKKIIRTLLIIPYPIPALVSILIWRNLLNPDFGALVRLQESIMGFAPNWLTDPNATKLAIILVNMWLSYPYFYIISSGALQALPAEILDAAEVDGASAWQKFTRITFPLLLRIVSPLLVASFAFNFNNFNLIYIFNEGNPPIAGTPIPAGHTDILISFVYKLAFTSALADYGLAAAISIVLFAFVAIITWAQFNYTGVFEDEDS